MTFTTLPNHSLPRPASSSVILVSSLLLLFTSHPLSPFILVFPSPISFHRTTLLFVHHVVRSHRLPTSKLFPYDEDHKARETLLEGIFFPSLSVSIPTSYPTGHPRFICDSHRIPPIDNAQTILPHISKFFLHVSSSLSSTSSFF